MIKKTNLTQTLQNNPIQTMRNLSPLIHHITNAVAINLQANAAIALGCRPIMTSHPLETRETTSKSQALLLNCGTPTSDTPQAFQNSLQIATQKDIPILLDPVGYGLTNFRNLWMDTILQEHSISIIKGNAGEIAKLAGLKAVTKGIDSLETQNQKQATIQLAAKYKTTVASTGKTDYISDGHQTWQITGGAPQITKISAGGCLTGTVISCLTTILPPLEATILGLVVMKKCAEKAAQKDPYPPFMISHLLNELFNLTDQTLQDWQTYAKEITQ